MEILIIELFTWLICWFVLFKMIKPFEEIKVTKEHHGDIQRWSSSTRAGGYGMVIDKERGVGVKSAVSAEECQNRANKLMNTNIDKIIFRKAFLKSLILSQIFFCIYIYIIKNLIF